MPAEANSAGPPEKYRTGWQYACALARRETMRAVLRPLVTWAPMRRPVPGYTIVIGSMLSLSKLLRVNLTMLERQEHADLHEVIVVQDSPPTPEARAVEAELRGATPGLPLRFVYQRPHQSAVLRAINWAWCDLWLSWAVGVAEAETRHVVLHDLDAMLLRPDLLRERYDHAKRCGDEFIGVRYYAGNGLTPDDGLAVTFEMIFDAAYVRGSFAPVDLFNRVARFRGRRVELDTFLDVQTHGSRSSLLPIDKDHMVHPSQLICQYAGLRSGRRYVPPATNNLPLMPYFLYLAGDSTVLVRHRDGIDRAEGATVPFLEEQMDLSAMSPEHLAWVEQQAMRLERHLAGDVRPDVAAYFESLQRFLQRRDRRRGAASRATAPGADPAAPSASVAT